MFMTHLVSHEVNDSFTGHVLMMHRPTELGEHAPYSDYFSKKTRRWELRLQGGLEIHSKLHTSPR